MIYALAYVLTLLIFAGLDYLWLSNMGGDLFRKTLGPILVDDIRKPPVVAFYLMYPAGMLLFAIAPALKSGSLATAFIYGALFGFFTYGTYDFTNYATLRDWTLSITVLDLAYGTIASGLVAVIVTAAAPHLAGLFGLR